MAGRGREYSGSQLPRGPPDKEKDGAVVLSTVCVRGVVCTHLHPSSSFLLLECSFSFSPLGIYFVVG